MRGPYSFLTLCLVLVSTACAQEKIIFEEDFNSDTLNMEIWNYEEGDGCPNLCGWGNNEKQIYNRDYVALEDGKLVVATSASTSPRASRTSSSDCASASPTSAGA